jgi:nucleoside 2-deoxyribosyltransferase
MIYLIGSLRNPEVPNIANNLRAAGFEVFDDWYAAGPEADDYWKQYEEFRGRTYMEALAGAAAKNVFEFDRRNIESSDSVILVLPAGKSGHLELGWAIGRGKRGYILLDSPDRWDVMYQFASLVTDDLNQIIADLNEAPQYADVNLEKATSACPNCKITFNIRISTTCPECLTSTMEMPPVMPSTSEDPPSGEIPTPLVRMGTGESVWRGIENIYSTGQTFKNQPDGNYEEKT